MDGFRAVVTALLPAGLGVPDQPGRSSSVISNYLGLGLKMAFVILVLSVALVDLARAVVTALKVLLADLAGTLFVLLVDLARAVITALAAVLDLPDLPGRSSSAVSSDTGWESRKETIIPLSSVIRVAVIFMMFYFVRELRSIQRLTSAPTSSSPTTPTSATPPTPEMTAAREVAAMPPTSSPPTRPTTPAARPEISNPDDFRVGRKYALLSPDGMQVLQATYTPSQRGTGANAAVGAAVAAADLIFKVGKFAPQVPGGTSLKFEDRSPEALSSDESQFYFSDNGGRYRLHSVKHNARMLFFLGTGVTGNPREWVVWNDDNVSKHGDWEVLEVEWHGAKVKLKGHDGQYPKWSGFVFEATKNATEAMEFILRQV